MFIDIHVHTRKAAGPLRTDGTTYATPEQLLRQYDQMGIEAGVILPSVSPECAFGVQSNQEALEVCALHPGRFIPFCNVDPREATNSADAPLGDILRFHRDRGCKGVGEVTCNLPFLDPLVQNLFRHVQEAGLPLTFHIAPKVGGVYGLYDEPGLPQLERSLQAFPKLRFLGHSPPFWAEIARLRKTGDRCEYPKYPVEEEGALPRLMRTYGNLLGDLSAGSGHNALARDREYTARFLEEFQDRLYFGTDICTAFQDAPLAGLLKQLRDEGKITETVFRKVARENAVRLLGLQ